ncbi:psbQ 3, chloroplastic [Olea europaea subsp. europaea]|uniref:PsbQ 3, chloroplastic n=1 Tax=Olea europaea subsp. europaea TaxID=158383 RepID=A0A8S0SD18_OLEEU|nr:psbQ 3, chloroplastic [Olea europaea subsp. europaea]
MASLPLLNQPIHHLLKNHHPIKTSRKPPKMALTTRRKALNILITSLTLVLNTQRQETANAIDFRMTVPDQTLEEAETGIKTHAQNLLQVKDLLLEESYKEAQKNLRKSSSLLKQDIYTIIQAKPGKERPLLRKLYSDLFNSVTRLDYAARDEDRTRVWECYHSIVLALDDLLSKL